MKSRAVKTAVNLALRSACRLFLAAAISASHCSSGAMAAGNRMESAIELKQSHYFLGDNIVTAANDAVRIQNAGRLKFVLVAKAPDWRVNIYRTDDKTYFSESLKEFLDTGLVSDFLVSRRDRFQDASTFRKSPMTYLGHAVVRVTGSKRSYKYIQLPPGMAQQVELIIYNAYKLTTWGNLPVEETGRTHGVDFFFGDPNEKKQTYLSTQAIRDVKVAADFFDLPAKYKKAKSLREVVAGSDTREESVDAQALFESARNPHEKKQKARAK